MPIKLLSHAKMCIVEVVMHSSLLIWLMLFSKEEITGALFWISMSVCASHVICWWLSFFIIHLCSRWLKKCVFMFRQKFQHSGCTSCAQEFFNLLNRCNHYFRLFVCNMIPRHIINITHFINYFIYLNNIFIYFMLSK